MLLTPNTLFLIRDFSILRTNRCNYLGHFLLSLKQNEQFCFPKLKAMRSVSSHRVRQSTFAFVHSLKRQTNWTLASMDTVRGTWPEKIAAPLAQSQRHVSVSLFHLDELVANVLLGKGLLCSFLLTDPSVICFRLWSGSVHSVKCRTHEGGPYMFLKRDAMLHSESAAFLLRERRGKDAATRGVHLEVQSGHQHQNRLSLK